jgi:hypothetical protein
MSWRATAVKVPGIDDVEPAERRGRTAQQIIKHEDQQQAEEEGWHGLPERGEHAADAVHRASGLQRCANAEADASEARDDERGERQLQGGGQPVHQVGEHRLAGGQRAPEIALGQLAEIAEKLRGDIAVEAELAADLLDRVGRRGRAGEIGSGIARQDARQHKGEGDHAEERGHRRQQSRCNQPCHHSVLPLAGLTVTNAIAVPAPKCRRASETARSPGLSLRDDVATRMIYVHLSCKI